MTARAPLSILHGDSKTCFRVGVQPRNQR